MSGHSKWAQTKHKKAVIDAKRGKLFSRFSKEIIIAAKTGGGDPNANARLRLAIERAKGANMPAENIKRAIMRGTGELPGVSFEEVVYEGYGPGGVALMIEILSDNKTRTISEIRHVMSKHGGNIGETGCVSWIFDKKGYILVDKKQSDEDTLMSLVLDAGAEDMKNDPEEENYEIITAMEDLRKVKETLEKTNIKINFAEITMLPKNYVKLGQKEAVQMLKLVDALEDQDDVQNVYANFDIPEEIMAKAN
ncbi:MAG: YebC/PmpR family DNA-binding transcriptional regulator [Nitrospirae bacterium]|nr:YebC/PmpR family DNA-binding transcriptional regulator [Nitrospirota bacterium]